MTSITKVIIFILALCTSVAAIVIGALDGENCDIYADKAKVSINTYLIVFGVVTIFGEIITLIEFLHEKWPKKWMIYVIYQSKWFTLFIETFRVSWHLVAVVSFTTNPDFDECSYSKYALIIWFISKFHFFYKIIGLLDKFKKKHDNNYNQNESTTHTELDEDVLRPEDI